MSKTPTRRLNDQRSDELTLITEGTTVTGDFSGRSDLLIAGTVRGDCDTDTIVTIGDSGSWHGNIRASAVIVAGEVNGSIFARGAVEVCATARIKGTVCGSAIAVGQGAVIDGELKTQHDESIQPFDEKRSAD